jgi:hypothetical protein
MGMMLLFCRLVSSLEASKKIIRMSIICISSSTGLINKAILSAYKESLCPVTPLESDCNSPCAPVLINRLLSTYMIRINNMGDKGSLVEVHAGVG